MYLTVDGGGTKLRAILFDDALRSLREGRSGGVNTTQNTPEEVLSHVRDCLEQVLSGGEALQETFVVFVGDRALFERELRERVSVERVTFFGEASAGMLAGSGSPYGLLAIAGTGSDVFLLEPGRKTILGGWGSVLGDEGGGTWIGQRALQAVVRDVEGWGEPTAMTGPMLDRFGAREDPRLIINAVHGAPSPFPVVARVVPLAAEAARAGDAAALSIFQEAGRQLGLQMRALLRRTQTKRREITLCGGVWKSHPAVFDAFCETVREEFPDALVHRPWFEHLMAGPMELLLRRGADRNEARTQIARAFPGEVLDLEGL